MGPALRPEGPAVAAPMQCGCAETPQTQLCRQGLQRPSTSLGKTCTAKTLGLRLHGHCQVTKGRYETTRCGAESKGEELDCFIMYSFAERWARVEGSQSKVHSKVLGSTALLGRQGDTLRAAMGRISGTAVSIHMAPPAQGTFP